MKAKRPIRHDTPVDTPAASDEDLRPTKEQLKQQQEWEAQAAQYKADGYNSGVVTRKMITAHGMPEAQAAALVGGLFGKTVNPRLGDTTGAVFTGAAMLAAGLGGAFIYYSIVGIGRITLAILVYGALLGLAGKGATQMIIALVNANSDEPLSK